MVQEMLHGLFDVFIPLNKYKRLINVSPEENGAPVGVNVASVHIVRVLEFALRMTSRTFPSNKVHVML